MLRLSIKYKILKPFGICSIWKIFSHKPIWGRIFKTSDLSGPWQGRLMASLASQFLRKWRCVEIKGQTDLRRHCWNTQFWLLNNRCFSLHCQIWRQPNLENALWNVALNLYTLQYSFLMHRIILTSHGVNYVLAITQYIRGKDKDRTLYCRLVL